MISDSSSSSSEESNQSQSVNFSYFSSSASPNHIQSIPQSSSVTPERSSSQYEAQAAKGKKKKNKKKPLRKTKANQKDNQKQSNSNKFVMSPVQAKYLNQVGFPKQYSLQNINQKEEESPIKKKGIIIAPKEFLQPMRIRFSLQDFKSGKLKISEGYHFIENFINEALKDKEVPQFFKKNIEAITKFESARKYYTQYRKIIKNPLNLSLLLQMSRDGRIKNFIEFKLKFEEMILNNQFYHTLKGNLRMINSGESLKRKFQDKFCQELNPEGNTFEQEMIKVFEKKRPKQIDQKAENSQQKPIILMDLNDEYNKYRISVMNQFLREICLKYQQKIQVILGKLQNIMNNHKQSKVEIVRCEQKSQGSMEKKRFLKKSAELTGTESLSKSPYSSNSDILSEQQTIYYRVVPERIEVDLFQQWKRFISRQVQEKKDFYSFGGQMREEPERMMYPREDSEDFDLSDGSDDS